MLLGKGILLGMDNRIGYKYWGYRNELVDRLRLLLVSVSAVYTDHNNEIISIEEKLFHIIINNVKPSKPARININRSKVIIKLLHDAYQAALVEMISHYKENKDYTFIVVVINYFSKFVSGTLLKIKEA